jgi:predicted Zn-dependent peptidase
MMKKISILTLALFIVALGKTSTAAEIKFKEFDLPNGLHVIVHEDHSVPIVAVSVMYHVGSKNEQPERTGFAHFFEHLMFEGTKNIERFEYDKLVERAGGTLNANTSNDRTYYYEILPSNQLELGLWLESERMLHARVDSIGIATQKGVVIEEKKQSVDNRTVPYFRNYKAMHLQSIHTNGQLLAMLIISELPKMMNLRSFTIHFMCQTMLFWF